MTEREMLELAAKAAGLDYRYEDGCVLDPSGSVLVRWNPRDNGNDALRLAVRLRLKVFCRTNGVQVANETGAVTAYEPHGRDPDAATRLAIFRAAVEIGRAMS